MKDVLNQCRELQKTETEFIHEQWLSYHWKKIKAQVESDAAAAKARKQIKHRVLLTSHEQEHQQQQEPDGSSEAAKEELSDSCTWTPKATAFQNPTPGPAARFSIHLHSNAAQQQNNVQNRSNVQQHNNEHHQYDDQHQSNVQQLHIQQPNSVLQENDGQQHVPLGIAAMFGMPSLHFEHQQQEALAVMQSPRAAQMMMQHGGGRSGTLSQQALASVASQFVPHSNQMLFQQGLAASSSHPHVMPQAQHMLSHRGQASLPFPGTTQTAQTAQMLPGIVSLPLSKMSQEENHFAGILSPQRHASLTFPSLVNGISAAQCSSGVSSAQQSTSQAMKNEGDGDANAEQEVMPLSLSVLHLLF